MAIHPAYPGLTATVNIDSTSLPEYIDPKGPSPNPNVSSPPASPSTATSSPAPPEKTYEVYIQSLPGKKFTVAYSIAPDFRRTSHLLGVVVKVDEKVVRREIVSKERLEQKQGASTVVEGVKDAMGQVKEMKFVGIEILDDEKLKGTLEEDKKKMGSVGAIVVEFWRLSMACPLHPSSSGRGVELERIGTIHEKALKGQPKYHTAALGDPKEPKKPPTRFGVVQLDDDPFATFKFFYRSNRAMRELRIRPMTLEELRERVEELERERDRLAGIKQENGAKRKNVDEELYDAEEGPKAKKEKKEVEIIDLSED